MSNPLFPVTAAARLDITPGSSSRAFYFSLVAQYQFGTPIILGVSPAALAAQGGIPLYSQVGDPGILATVPGVVVVSFPNPVPSVVIGGVAYPVDVNAGGGTLYGVNWVDQNGVLHPDVDWAWAISVEPYLNTNPAPSVGTFDVRVVRYTGDGTSGRSINTAVGAFPAIDCRLTAGKTTVWICGLTTGNGKDYNVWRANHSAMLGTSIMGAGVGLPVTTSGVMSFTSTGFTVTDGSYIGVHYANANNVKYTAIVVRDTTSDNRYLTTGRYTGVAITTFSGTVTTINTGIDPYSDVVGAGYTPGWVGTGTDGTGTYTIKMLTATTATIRPNYPSLMGINLAVTSVSQAIKAPGVGSLTHAWVWGRSVAYRSTEFVGDASVVLANEGNPVTDTLKGQGSAPFIDGVHPAFTIGQNNNVNNNGSPYDYQALAVDSVLAASHLFGSGKATGTFPLALTLSNSVLPEAAFARQYTVNSTGGIWRGGDHSGTDSAWCTFTSKSDIPSTGITAITGSTLTCGSDLAPAANDAYGWGWKSGSLNVPATPIFVPNFPPTGPLPPYIPPAGPPGVPLPVPPGPPGGGHGCVSTVASGAGNVGGAGCVADLPVAVDDSGSLGGLT